MSAFDDLVLGFGPSLYLKLEDAAGTTATDSSGNGLNGTYAGTKTLASTSLVSGDPPSVSFPDGTGNVTVAFDPRLQAGALTVGCMVQWGVSAPASRNVVNGRSGSGYNLGTNGSGLPQLLLGSAGINGGSIAANTTYLMVATFDGFQSTVWLNATQAAGQTWDLNNTLVPSISTSAGITIQPNNAKIGKVFFIPNRALTPLEIHQLYEYSLGNTSYTMGGFPAVPKYYLDPASGVDGRSLWSAQGDETKPFASLDGVTKVAPRDSLVFCRAGGTYPLWQPTYGNYNNYRDRTSTASGLLGRQSPGHGLRGGGYITFTPYPGENPLVGALQPKLFRHLRFVGFQNMVASDTSGNGFATLKNTHHFELLHCDISNPTISDTTTEVEKLDLKGATSGSFQLRYSTRVPTSAGSGSAVVQGTTASLAFNATAAQIQTALNAIVAASPRPADDSSGGASSITVTVRAGGSDGAGPYDLTWGGSYAGQPVGGPATIYGGYINGDAADGGPAMSIVSNTLAGGTGTAAVSTITGGGYIGATQLTAVNFGANNEANHHHRVEGCTVTCDQGIAIQVAGKTTDMAHDIVVKDNDTVPPIGAKAIYLGSVDTCVVARNLISGVNANPGPTHADGFQLSGAAINVWVIANEMYGPQFLSQFTGFGGQVIFNGYVINNLIYNSDGPGNGEFPWTSADHDKVVGYYEAFNTVWGQTSGLSTGQFARENHHFCNALIRWSKAAGADYRTSKLNVVGIADGSTYGATDIVGTASPGGLDWDNNTITLPAVSNQGTAGATTYQYRVVSIDAQGKRALAGATVTTPTGNATLNGTNYNQITWTGRPGAASYDVLKLVGGNWQKMGNVAASPYNDQGGATTAYTLPTVNEGQPQWMSSPPTTTNVAGSGGPWTDPRPAPTDNVYHAGASIAGLAIPSFGQAGIAFVGSVPTTDFLGGARNTSTPSIGAVEG